MSNEQKRGPGRPPQNRPAKVKATDPVTELATETLAVGQRPGPDSPLAMRAVGILTYIEAKEVQASVLSMSEGFLEGFVHSARRGIAHLMQSFEQYPHETGDVYALVLARIPKAKLSEPEPEPEQETAPPANPDAAGPQ